VARASRTKRGAQGRREIVGNMCRGGGVLVEKRIADCNDYNRTLTHGRKYSIRKRKKNQDLKGGSGGGTRISGVGDKLVQRLSYTRNPTPRRDRSR